MIQNGILLNLQRQATVSMFVYVMDVLDCVSECFLCLPPFPGLPRAAPTGQLKCLPKL